MRVASDWVKPWIRNWNHLLFFPSKVVALTSTAGAFKSVLSVVTAAKICVEMKKRNLCRRSIMYGCMCRTGSWLWWWLLLSVCVFWGLWAGLCRGTAWLCVLSHEAAIREEKPSLFSFSSPSLSASLLTFRLSPSEICGEEVKSAEVRTGAPH